MSEHILYHGTLATNVDAILKHGLRPRRKTRTKSHDAYLGSDSLPDFVYLSKSPWVAATHAARITERVHGGAHIAIVQVNLNDLATERLYPDEDYISSEWNSDFVDFPLKLKMEYMENHRDEWADSLDNHHTAAYRGIVKPVILSHLVPGPNGSIWSASAMCEFAKNKYRQDCQRLLEIRSKHNAA